MTGPGAPNIADSLGLDNYLGDSRFYSHGSNTSTQGSYDFHTASSDGSIDNIQMQITPSGVTVSEPLVALQPVSMPTGSTVNSTNICLADGTGCPSGVAVNTGAATITAFSGSNTTSVVCDTGSGAVCNNLHGKIQVFSSAAEYGPVVTVSFSATPATYECTATFAWSAGTDPPYPPLIGSGAYATTGFNIYAKTAGANTVGYDVDYSCKP